VKKSWSIFAVQEEKDAAVIMFQKIATAYEV